ncbi:MAG TPA: integrase arm-type DNA-binding domain-containing protein [Caulobacteraceae bacterium]|jgi:integrase
MPLSDLAIRNAKPRPAPYKLSDSGGLFVQITPSGGKLWRLKYRFQGKEKLLSFGPYPSVSLADARDRREHARKLLQLGKDPGVERKERESHARREASETFRVLAEEFIAREEQKARAPHTITKLRWVLLELARPLHPRPIRQITPQHALEVLKVIEARGLRESARRCRSSMSRVFRYAIMTGRASADPTYALQGALLAPAVTHHAAIIDPRGVGELMRAINALEGSFVVRNALQLMALCYPRPGELRQAEWPEFDLQKRIWTIPAERMKMRRPHVNPLSRQATEVLERVRQVTGKGRLVFPGARTASRPLSENTLNAALRRLGYTTEQMSSHGFRTTASTLMNESGLWNPDAIERSLAHVDGNAVRQAYARGAYWEERVCMAQWWADYLDQLREGLNIQPT